MTATATRPNTVTVSPIDLVVGDKVMAHGAIFEVMHITHAECSVEGGIRVQACTSRLVGNWEGDIPHAYFDTRENLISRGCRWAHELPEGRYWNVQGNAHARVGKIIE